MLAFNNVNNSCRGHLKRAGIQIEAADGKRLHTVFNYTGRKQLLYEMWQSRRISRKKKEWYKVATERTRATTCTLTPCFCFRSVLLDYKIRTSSTRRSVSGRVYINTSNAVALKVEICHIPKRQWNRTGRSQCSPAARALTNAFTGIPLKKKTYYNSSIIINDFETTATLNQRGIRTDGGNFYYGLLWACWYCHSSAITAVC